MLPFLSILGILCTVIFMAIACYRGHSMCLIAPIAAIMILLSSDMSISDGMLGSFAEGVGKTMASFLFVFISTALFSQIIIETGATEIIADWFADRLGVQNALIIICLFSTLLALGGMVSVGTYYIAAPVALALCSRADYSQDIILGCIIGGSWTYALCAPFTPSVHNAVCSSILHTGNDAGAIPGLAACVLMLAMDLIFLSGLARHWQKKGRRFSHPKSDMVTRQGNNTQNIRTSTVLKAFFPLLAVFFVYNIFSVSMITALLCGALCGFLLHIRDFPAQKWVSIAEKGIVKGITSVSVVATVGGIGNVVVLSPAFQWAFSLMEKSSIHPYVLAVLSGSAMSLCLGSAVNSLNVVLPHLLPLFQAYTAQGFSMGCLHRLICMGTLMFGVMPYNGSLQVCLHGLNTTHRESYMPVFVTTAVTPVLAVMFAALPISILFY